MTLPAIVPASGRITGEFAEVAGTDLKAQLTVGGTALLQYALQSLRHCPLISRIIVIGPQELADPDLIDVTDTWMRESSSPVAGIVSALESMRNCEQLPVVLMASDLPFITSQGIEDFLQRCPSDADLCIPVIERSEFRTRFPGAPGKYVPLRDGRWTIGSLFRINPAAFITKLEWAERMFAGRKRAIRLATLLGWPTVLRLLTWQLTIDDLVRRGAELLECRVAAVRGCAPELAFDIDGIEEYRYAQKRMTTHT